MPSLAASRFMRSTNASSEPATASASAMAASLPDCTISPRSSTSTRKYALAAMAGGGTAAAGTLCAPALAATQRSASSTKKWRQRNIGKKRREGPHYTFVALFAPPRGVVLSASQKREVDVGLA